MFSLTDKAALITGAAGGIGKAIAERFIAAGARVVITDVADAREAARAMGAGYLPVDVSDEDSVAEGFREAASLLG
ncbi:MAG: SDR family oxidoreductase, partial [Gammaproteobacteria bacterium]|nr:SDR family oxidoreductase [Gammaproteobacteria bacterium]NNK33822.1 SDR family oxidoreductase [Xanthomonadales bacterium]